MTDTPPNAQPDVVISVRDVGCKITIEFGTPLISLVLTVREAVELGEFLIKHAASAATSVIHEE